MTSKKQKRTSLDEFSNRNVALHKDFEANYKWCITTVVWNLSLHILSQANECQNLENERKRAQEFHTSCIWLLLYNFHGLRTVRNSGSWKLHRFWLLMNNEVRMLRCSEFAGYRCIAGNVVSVRAKHQRAAATPEPVLMLIRYHPGSRRQYISRSCPARGAWLGHTACALGSRASHSASIKTSCIFKSLF